MHTTSVDFAQLKSLAVHYLMQHNVSETNAESVVTALLDAEIQHIRSHGLSRLIAYAEQASKGKVNGHAQAELTMLSKSLLRVDAHQGFAFPALKLAREQIIQDIDENGIMMAAIHHSHHFGVAGYHVEQLAKRGYIGIIFGNSPKAIAPWGGSRPLFGTNPIGFAAPRKQQGRCLPPIVIDLSLSKVARGKVMYAKQQGKSIPKGWAIDIHGQPTTDPDLAMAGSMLPMGDAKGYALVLMVEILSAALTGACFGFEASSFFDATGEPPNVGQLLLAIDPQKLSNHTFFERLELLLQMIQQQPNVRIPGQRRFQLREQFDGQIKIPTTLYERLIGLNDNS